MDLHDALVLSHILATAGLFAATGVEHVALNRLSSATHASDARHWLEVYRNPAGGLGQASMVVLLLSGGAMGLTRWGLEGWMLAALLGVAGLIVAGGVISTGPLRRLTVTFTEALPADAGVVTDAVPRLRLWSHGRAGVLVGILVVMVVKPSFVVAAVAIALTGAAAMVPSLSLRPAATQRPS